MRIDPQALQNAAELGGSIVKGTKHHKAHEGNSGSLKPDTVSLAASNVASAQTSLQDASAASALVAKTLAQFIGKPSQALSSHSAISPDDVQALLA